MASACASLACRGALGLATRASAGSVRAVAGPASVFFRGTAQSSTRAAAPASAPAQGAPCPECPGS